MFSCRWKNMYFNLTRESCECCVAEMFPAVAPYPSYRPTSIRCSNDRQALFNRIAPVYDNLNDLLSLGQHRIWKRMAVSWTEAKKGDRVLDVCCGSGDLSFLLSNKVASNGKANSSSLLFFFFFLHYVEKYVAKSFLQFYVGGEIKIVTERHGEVQI
ncbi:putative ubiE/COQ5 methyltransferase, S-adenosyl-L-methionine-dependent methyltransferase [Medicago truncatula]|uniref:Putative ubiE/COQ5 methyltransferase, S-adenosyl-L-methionine-dependent methyltransferase n=1 Tax=Medicago truncatula TaxID=3880 RepID=A0A396HNV1_MEDTR|nr:putative ubiE/COQ5 methyltransferase, S-adenosyl-L-methionine-dependent methyltransferase [Medicago truncatula]